MGKLNILKIGVFIIGISFLGACSENSELEIDTNNLLIGNWTEPTYNNESITFKRSNTLQNNNYGVSFKTAGVFIEHSSGWCGTPPLVFIDYEGDWQLQGTLITVMTQNFPGDFNWRIISLTENQLIVKRELSEQEKEHRILMDLFNEIELIANSVDCSNSNDWTYTAYGSKACGGPQGYIAYSTLINEVDFLKKVKHYTKSEDEFNIKWGIISTCEFSQPPVKIVCENGSPVLKY